VSGAAEPAPERDRPVLRVIRGDATEEEIGAALAVVLARTGASTPPPDPGSPSLWGSARHRSVRVSPSGKHVDASMLSWRTSFWPR
jgi:hypothetical protein